jgi:hypothetical protein
MPAAADTPDRDRDDDAPDFAVTVPEEPTAHDDPPAAGGDEMPPLALLPTLGHVGRYALKQPLGAGGLGTVHAALDPLLGRAIAVKTLHLDPAALQGQPLDALLLHEARAAAGLSHPHIVTVYDAGLAPEGVYIAMERLQGRDLRHRLADGWRPTPAEAALIVRRVADALAYAHSKGVIHCDIKPANIFMVGRVQPKVLDFGIARITGGADAPAGQALAGGSPFYMAPEQLRGEAIDLRCDVYALGAVMYELLAGQRPFGGPTLDAIRDAVLHAPLVPLRTLCPAVPAALAEIAQRALARDPSERWQSARQMSRALRSALAGMPAAARSSTTDERAGSLLLPLAAAATVAAGGLWFFLSPAVDDGAARSAKVVAATSPAPTRVAAPLPDAEPPAAAAAPQTTTPAPAAPPARRAAARRAPAAAPVAGDVAAPAATGVLQLAVTPWGEVEVNGQNTGTTPPLARLTLPAGTHTVVIRNDDFPPYRTTVTVGADRAATVRHRFGS